MNDQSILLPLVCTTLLILLLVAGIVMTFVISAQRRYKHETELANTKLHFERELRQVETEVSEQVMGQFAHELHDNIGQLLTAMHIQVENQKLDHPELAEGLKPIDIYLGEVSQQLRILSRTMNHDYIGHIGLLSAIEMEVARLVSLKRLAVHWAPATGASNLDKNQELMVFRIFQEIIHNALRHSSAKNVYITIDNQAGRFDLEVRDDGKGCHINEILQSNKASGLRNMMKRAALAKMTCTIQSLPGQGCLVRIGKAEQTT